METEIAELNDTIEFLMENLGDTQTSLGRVIGVAQPQVGKRLRGDPPWKYVELLMLAEHWGIPITTMCAGKHAAAQWLADRLIDLREQRKRTSTWDVFYRSDALRLFDPDELPAVIDLRDHAVDNLNYEEPLALLRNAS